VTSTLEPKIVGAQLCCQMSVLNNNPTEFRTVSTCRTDQFRHRQKLLLKAIGAGGTLHTSVGFFGIRIFELLDLGQTLPFVDVVESKHQHRHQVQC
jgi:hypothetical protein